MEKEFIDDYYNNLSIDEIKAKYNIGNTTYFALLKRLNIKRRASSKISRILGGSHNNNIEKPKANPKTSHIPIDDVYKKIDETDNNLIYSKQYVPRGTKLDIEKKPTTTTTKPKQVAKKEQVFKEVDENELNAILDKADKTIAKIQNKKQGKNTENKNK